MTQPPGLKAALKRGALVAAANWPLVAVQFVTEATFKLLLAVPIVGGAFLVVLLLGADVEQFLTGDIRVLGAVVSALGANPAALVAFAVAFLVVLLGGSVLTFIVKGGTVSVLAAAEAQAGPIERPPLRLETLRRANVTNIEPFLAGCKRLWRRYVRLGGLLLLAYAITALPLLYLSAVARESALSSNTGVLLGWTMAAFVVLSVLVVWITLINFFYLLTQMIVSVDDVGVRVAAGRVFAFLRASLREIAAILGVVLLLALLATVVSLLATAGLGLIAFVPLAGLAVLPLQVAAWLLRGFVFQYLALTALAAYLTQYRHYQRGRSEPALVHPISEDVPGKRSA